MRSVKGPQQGRGRWTRRGFIWLVLALGALGLGAAAGCKKKPSGGDPQPCEPIALQRQLPEPGQMVALAGGPLLARLAEAPHEATIQLTLAADSAGAVEGSQELLDAGRLLRFQPATALQVQTDYAVRLELVRAPGCTVQVEEWSFRTGAGDATVNPGAGPAGTYAVDASDLWVIAPAGGEAFATFLDGAGLLLQLSQPNGAGQLLAMASTSESADSTLQNICEQTVELPTVSWDDPWLRLSLADATVLSRGNTLQFYELEVTVRLSATGERLVGGRLTGLLDLASVAGSDDPGVLALCDSLALFSTDQCQDCPDGRGSCVALDVMNLTGSAVGAALLSIGPQEVTNHLCGNCPASIVIDSCLPNVWPEFQPFEAVSVEYLLACGLHEGGGVSCWDYYVPTYPGDPQEQLSSVSVGHDHACGLRTSDDTAICWGDNTDGEATPLAGSFLTLSSGNNFTCGVQSEGGLACWGSDTLGKATPPVTALSFVSLSAGASSACALTADATAVCWGSDQMGQASPPAGTFDSIAVADRFACGLESTGSLVCWGFAGDGRTSPPLGSYHSFDLGGGTGCALDSNGLATCWGKNDVGQALPPDDTFISVSVGADRACGLRTGGRLRCWGNASRPPGALPAAP